MAPLELNPYERLPREQQDAGGLPWRLFTFSIFLLVVACGCYLGLKFGYGPILDSRIEQLDADLAGLAEQIPEADRNHFITLYSQLVNLQSVIKKHTMASVVFPVLEANTNTNVYYTNFDLSVTEQRLSLEGVARSYEALAQQLEAWNRVPQITRSYIAESQLQEGKVHFRIVLTFAPSFMAPNNRSAINPPQTP